MVMVTCIEELSTLTSWTKFVIKYLEQLVLAFQLQKHSIRNDCHMLMRNTEEIL